MVCSVVVVVVAESLVLDLAPPHAVEVMPPVKEMRLVSLGDG